MRENYSELVRFRAPEGFIASVAAAAKREGLSLSAYLRRLAMLAANKSGPDGADDNGRPDRGVRMSMHSGPSGALAMA